MTRDVGKRSRLGAGLPFLHTPIGGSMDDPEMTTVPPLPDVIFGDAPPDESGWWFHLREGLYFKGDGTAVTIAVRQGDRTFKTVTVPPNEWASAVAAVSKRGDVHSAWSEALRLHEADG